MARTAEGDVSRKEKWEAITEERVEAAASLVWQVIPKAEDKAIAKHSVAQMAIALKESMDGAFEREFPFFEDHSKDVLTTKYIIRKWPDIKLSLALDNKCITWDHRGVWGTHSKKRIADAAAAHAAMILASKDRYNDLVEAINKVKQMQLPNMNVNLLASGE